MTELLDKIKIAPFEHSNLSKPKLEDYQNVDSVFEYVIHMIRLSITVGAKGFERDDWHKLIEILLSVECIHQEYNRVWFRLSSFGIFAKFDRQDNKLLR